jgi:hypothetical protein
LPVATHGRKLYRLTKVIKRLGLLGSPESSREIMRLMIQILDRVLYLHLKL